MLNREQLRRYRETRRLSTRDVSYYCDLSQPMIVQIESGQRDLTEHNYREFIKGINNAFSAKQNKTFIKAPKVNKPKTEPGAKAYNQPTETDGAVEAQQDKPAPKKPTPKKAAPTKPAQKSKKAGA